MSALWFSYVKPKQKTAVGAICDRQHLQQLFIKSNQGLHLNGTVLVFCEFLANVSSPDASAFDCGTELNQKFFEFGQSTIRV